MNIDLNQTINKNLGLRFHRFLPVTLIERLNGLFFDVANNPQVTYRVVPTTKWTVVNEHDDYLVYDNKIHVAIFHETTSPEAARSLANRLNLYGSTPRELEEMAARHVAPSIPAVIH